jgi:hypothetical protein
MINKDYIESNYSLNPRMAIEDILSENKEYYLTKEEIYEHLPKLGDERVITIGQLNTALRELCKFGVIKYVYIKGKPYYAI